MRKLEWPKMTLDDESDEKQFNRQLSFARSVPTSRDDLSLSVNLNTQPRYSACLRVEVLLRA